MEANVGLQRDFGANFQSAGNRERLKFLEFWLKRPLIGAELSGSSRSATVDSVKDHPIRK
jgi:hypothetical protein